MSALEKAMKSKAKPAMRSKEVHLVNEKTGRTKTLRFGENTGNQGRSWLDTHGFLKPERQAEGWRFA